MRTTRAYRIAIALIAVAAFGSGSLLAQHGHGGGHGGHAGGHLAGHGGHGGGHHSGGLAGGHVGLGHGSRVVGGGHFGELGRVGHVGGGLAIAHDHVFDDLAHHDVLFAHHGVHVGLIIGVPFYPAYPYYALNYPLIGYYYGRYRIPPPPGDQYATGEAGELAVEVNANVLRLTWREGNRVVQEAALFVADSGERVLAVQTVRAPPFTALFDVTPDIAYIGATLVYDDGTKSTTLVPYTAPRR